MHSFEYLLAPGSLVGQLQMEITLPTKGNIRHNVQQALSPNCKSAEAHHTVRNSFRRRASCLTKLTPSIYRRVVTADTQKLTITLDQSRQKEFNEMVGIKRWISARVDLEDDPEDENRSVDYVNDEADAFRFPVYDALSPTTCKALIISIKQDSS